MVGPFNLDTLINFVDPASILIVLGGTLAVVVACYPKLAKSFPKHFKIMLRLDAFNPEQYVEKLTELEVDTPHAAETFHQAEYDEEVRGIIALVKKYAQKYGKSIPVVTAGGIYDHADVMHQMELGADGVQVATPFL